MGTHPSTARGPGQLVGLALAGAATGALATFAVTAVAAEAAPDAPTSIRQSGGTVSRTDPQTQAPPSDQSFSWESTSPGTGGGTQPDTRTGGS